MKTFITFLLGAATGVGCSALLLKKYYENIANEEIESVKKSFSNKAKKESNENKENENKDKDKENEHAKKIEELETIKKVIQDHNYSAYSKPEKEDAKMDEKPYVIPPEDFADLDDYETVSLTYYSDGVLTDDMNEVVDDIEGTVGEDSLTHFGEYEDDSVFVRNDERKCDYEILLDDRAYSEVVRNQWKNN